MAKLIRCFVRFGGVPYFTAFSRKGLIKILVVVKEFKIPPVEAKFLSWMIIGLEEQESKQLVPSLKVTGKANR